MSYPNSIDTFANAAGTSPLSNPDHASDHNNMGSAIGVVEQTLGTTAASGIIQGWSAGQVPVKSQGGTLQQNLIGGTLTGNVINSATVGTPTMNVGSDATGDTYYNGGAGALTRLAIGAAGAFLTTDGTTPAWATSRYKVGSTTRDMTTASGTQVITGAGFTPKAAIFLSAVQSAAQASWGFDDATTHVSIRTQGTSVPVDAFFSNDTTNSITYNNNGGSAYSGYVSGFNSDGGSIVWTKTGSPTGTLQVMYILFR